MDKATQNELLTLVKKNYAEIARHYNETRKKHLEPLWSALAAFAKEAPVQARVLDVGCGNGRLLEAFGNKQISYLGIDPCEPLIKLARKQKPGRRFELGNVLELNRLKESDFDYIFFTAVIHHLPGKDLRVKALKQIKNKISDKGKIIITAWNMWPQKRFRKLIFQYNFQKLIGKNKMDFNDILFFWKDSRSGMASERYYHAFTLNELKRLASFSGLKIEKLFKDKFNYYLVVKKT